MDAEGCATWITGGLIAGRGQAGGRYRKMKHLHVRECHIKFSRHLSYNLYMTCRSFTMRIASNRGQLQEFLKVCVEGSWELGVVQPVTCTPER